MAPAPNAIHTSLLRPPILHILRAAGFQATRPAVLDTLVDLTSRYLTILASSTASHALSNHNTLDPTITDVRLALQDCGALYPQRSAMEEQALGEEDLRGVERFIEWMTGDANKEIRRVAGLASEEIAPGTEGELKEDFLAGMVVMMELRMRLRKLI